MQQPKINIVNKKKWKLPEENEKVFYSSDVWGIIFNYLNDHSCVKISRTCQRGYAFYKKYLKNSRDYKAGVTLMYKHQIEMMSWILNRLCPSARLLCNAYMSAGKTLIGYETAFRFLKTNTDKFVLIVVPPNVLRVWMGEAEKHYPGLSKGKTLLRKILFYSHLRSKDHDFILSTLGFKMKKSGAELNGRIIVTTPSSVTHFSKLIAASGLVIFDESHKFIEAYTKITVMKENVPCVYFTASHFERDFITDNYVLEKNKSFPKIDYSFIYCDGFYDASTRVNICNDIEKQKDEHIAVLTTNKTDPKWYSVNRTVYDFNNRQISNYKKFKTNGGVLLSTIKMVSEGNNFNDCSLAYIVCPHSFKLSTLKQTVGRFYRQSNKHDVIKLVFAVDANTQNWARCRLSVVKPEMKGFDGKATDRVKNINLFLKEKGYSVDNLTDDEIICLYAYRDYADTQLSWNMPDVAKLKPSTLNLQDLLHCMMS